MKPLTLKMSAFGPYKNETKIEFNKLGSKGIFLITGDTGAGKTTIFDAISYALFNEVSGSNRPISTLRSNFSSTEDTYVELKFEHKEKEYLVKRIPEYERPKKSGEGTTKNVADATLEYDDKIITGIKNVNEKIIELLGINSKQFKQISMLAQGEFIKILFAESKDRTEIFRKIFETTIYEQITIKLAELASNSRRNVEELKTRFQTNTENIRWIEKPVKIELIDFKKITPIDIDETLQTIKEEIEKEKQELEKEQKENETLKKEKTKIEEKIKKINEQNEKIKKYQTLIEEQKYLKEQEKTYEQKQEKLINLKKLYEENKNIIEKQEKNKEAEKTIENIKQAQKEKENYSKKYIEINNKYIEISNKYKIEEDKFFKEQAGIIAEKLEKGKPCPVCGSIDHPKKAQKSEEVLTEEQLKSLKQTLETEEQQNNQIKEKITALNSKIETLEKSIPESEDKLFNLSQYIEKTQKEKQELEQKQKEIKEKFKTISSKLTKSYKNIEDFDYDKSKEELEEQNKKDREKLIANQTRIQDLEKELTNKEIIDTIENNQKLEEISKEQENKEKSVNNIKAQININKDTQQKLKETAEELKEKMTKMAKIEELAKIANGSANGKTKITFEQYVQATYFDMVINEANKRLINMTDNRYTLIRKKKADKISEKIGLDLNVIDNYNGQERDVKSLSGGETFKAALSLALGLSDVIQTNSGGVVIETLFIDEGFGTLDAESREQAINTLITLAGTNKLIGIISHVDELKERIDKKIIITKEQKGSKAEIEY